MEKSVNMVYYKLRNINQRDILTEKIIKIIKNNKFLFFIAVICTACIHQFTGFTKGFEILPLIIFLLVILAVISPLLYFLIQLSYNFHKKYNPVLRLNELNYKNDFSICVCFFVLILAVLIDIVLPFFQDIKSFMPFMISPIIFAVLLSLIRIKEKSINEIPYEYGYKITKRGQYFSVLAIFFGAGWLICGACLFIHDELFKRNAYNTIGIVTDYEEHKEIDKGKTNNTYSIKYTYKDKDGNEHTNTANSASYPPEFSIGTQITVYYSKSDYNKSIYESTLRDFLTNFFAGAGAIILICGTIVYILIRTKEQK